MAADYTDGPRAGPHYRHVFRLHSPQVRPATADTSDIFVLRRQGDEMERIRFTYDALTRAEPVASRFELESGDVIVVE